MSATGIQFIGRRRHAHVDFTVKKKGKKKEKKKGGDYGWDGTE